MLPGLAATILAAALMPGCTKPAQQEKPKPPDPYVVQGRVLDAESGQPIPQARVRFLATLPTLLGPRSVSAMATSGPNGSYQMQIGAGYPILRAAREMRVDAGAEGYTVGGVDIPLPREKQEVYAAPDIKLYKTAAKTMRPRPGKPSVRRPVPTEPAPRKE